MAGLERVPSDQRLGPQRARPRPAEHRLEGMHHTVARATQTLQRREVAGGDQLQGGPGGERRGFGDRHQARCMPPGTEVVQAGVLPVTGQEVIDDDERAARSQHAADLAEERGRRVGVDERLDREGQIEAAQVLR